MATMWKILVLFNVFIAVLGLDFLDTAEDCASSKIQLDDEGREFLQCMIANSVGSVLCRGCETKFTFNMNHRNQSIDTDDRPPKEACQYFELGNANALYLDSRNFWAAGECLKCNMTQGFTSFVMISDEQRKFYDVYQQANKCVHQYIDHLDAADATCEQIFHEYRDLFNATKQRNKCRNTDELMYKLNTDSTIFNNDGQLVSQMRLYPGQNFSDLIGAFMPIFIMIGLVLSVSMLILICDFMKAYRKNKILTVNFRQQQQIV